MKTYRWVILGSLGCLLIAALGYFWATSLMDSLYEYRSPLAENPPRPGEALGHPHTDRVVLVLIDALREDTSLKPNVMPYLNEIRQNGAWATMRSRPPSYSAPCYSTLMTGAWPDISDGPAMNPDDGELPRTWTQDNLFSAVHRSGMKTAVSGYSWFEGLIPQADVDASFYTIGDDRHADRDVVDAAIPWLENGEYQFILIHIDQVDFAGHYEGGPRSPNWDAAASRADDLLREIASYLDLQHDTLIVLSDHGQIDAGGHGGHDPITLVEPFVAVGAGIQPGQYSDMQMVDIAPTIAALLGTNIPATSQGRILTELLVSTPEQAALYEIALGDQQVALATAYGLAIEPDVLLGPAETTEYAHEYARSIVQGARSSRLARERLPRFALAIILVLIPAGILFWKHSKSVGWLLGGALGYILLFNLRYAILDGRTYSLSSVASADDIISYSALTALIAFGLVWLCLMLGLRVVDKTTLKAAELSLALTFVTLYLISLPALWSFALNGMLITWTLPDFGSMFLGFLSILQSLVLAGGGLVLTGLIALVSRFGKKSQQRQI